MSLSYSDIVLIPKYSEVLSRSDIPTDVKLGDKTFKLPLIPANMKCVIDWKKAGELASNGYFYIMHRFDDYVNTIDVIKRLNEIPNSLVSISLGVKEKDYALLKTIVENRYRIDYVTIDVAHGHSITVKNMISQVKLLLPNTFIIAGNVATPEGARDLAEWGADAVKVGIGGGFACTTADKTGFTTDMFSTVREVYNILNFDQQEWLDGLKKMGAKQQLLESWTEEEIAINDKLIKQDVEFTKEVNAKLDKKNKKKSAEVVTESTNFMQVVQLKKKKVYIIADGGIRTNGDIAKALAAGADFVMAGSWFAKLKDSPAPTEKETETTNKLVAYEDPVTGALIKKQEIKNKFIKIYYGSASAENKGHNANIEGRVTRLDMVNSTYFQALDLLKQDLQSSVSYSGLKTLQEFIGKAEWRQIK